jgi:prophage DNA circulation protein
MRAELSATGSLSKSIVVSDGIASSVSSIKSKALNDRLNSNISAFKQLVLNAAAIGKADAIADCEFTYAQQASDASSGVADDLNELAKTAIESGDRASWRTFRALRFAVIEDTNERSLQLPVMRVVSTNRPIPVALLAWRELGDAEQRSDIIARNKISRPSFIPANAQIKVIDNG